MAPATKKDLEEAVSLRRNNRRGRRIPALRIAASGLTHVSILPPSLELSTGLLAGLFFGERGNRQSGS